MSGAGSNCIQFQQDEIRTFEVLPFLSKTWLLNFLDLFTCSKMKPTSRMASNYFGSQRSISRSLRWIKQMWRFGIKSLDGGSRFDIKNQIYVRFLILAIEYTTLSHGHLHWISRLKWRSRSQKCHHVVGSPTVENLRSLKVACKLPTISLKVIA